MRYLVGVLLAVLAISCGEASEEYCNNCGSDDITEEMCLEQAEEAGCESAVFETVEEGCSLTPTYTRCRFTNCPSAPECRL